MRPLVLRSLIHLPSVGKCQCVEVGVGTSLQKQGEREGECGEGERGLHLKCKYIKYPIKEGNLDLIYDNKYTYQGGLSVKQMVGVTSKHSLGS